MLCKSDRVQGFGFVFEDCDGGRGWGVFLSFIEINKGN